MKTAHTAKLRSLGASLDAKAAKQPGAKPLKPGELGPYQTITAFLSQSDSFLADATAAREVGRQELTASTSGSAAEGLQNHLDGALHLQVRIPGAYTDYDGAGNPSKRWILASQELSVKTGGSGSAQDSSSAMGTNSSVQSACTDLDHYITVITAYREQLRSALDVQ